MAEVTGFILHVQKYNFFDFPNSINVVQTIFIYLFIIKYKF